MVIGVCSVLVGSCRITTVFLSMITIPNCKTKANLSVAVFVDPCELASRAVSFT